MRAIGMHLIVLLVLMSCDGVDHLSDQPAADPVSGACPPDSHPVSGGLCACDEPYVPQSGSAQLFHCVLPVDTSGATPLNARDTTETPRFDAAAEDLAPPPPECPDRVTAQPGACSGAARFGPDTMVLAEGSPRVLDVLPFELDCLLVTTAEFAGFLDEVGSERAADEGYYACTGCDPGASVCFGEDLHIECVDGGFRIRQNCQSVPDGPSDASCAEHPVDGVTWHGARAFCESLGKRLPSEAEWEWAVKGANGCRFPWGNADPGPALANLYEPVNHDGFTGTSPVGYFADGVSPAGIADLGGNVIEWTQDCYLADTTMGPGTTAAYDAEYTCEGTGGNKRVIRGLGAYVQIRGFEDVLLMRRGGWEPHRASPGMGFRCAR